MLSSTTKHCIFLVFPLPKLEILYRPEVPMSLQDQMNQEGLVIVVTINFKSLMFLHNMSAMQTRRYIIKNREEVGWGDEASESKTSNEQKRYADILDD
jgi:hypothetical protein